MTVAASSLTRYCSPTARAIRPSTLHIPPPHHAPPNALERSRAGEKYQSGLSHTLHRHHLLPLQPRLEPFKVSEIIFCELTTGLSLEMTRVVESYLGAPNAAQVLRVTLRALWEKKIAVNGETTTIVVADWQDKLAVPERVLRHIHMYEKELVALNLSDIPIGPRVLQQIVRCCTMLRKLNLNKCRITDDAYKVCQIVSMLPHLQFLDLSGNLLSGNLADKPLAPLSRLKNLRKLDLSGCVDSDDDGDSFVAEDLSSLEELPQLHTLYFNSNPNFGRLPEEATIFARLASVRKIIMNGCAHLSSGFVQKLRTLRPILTVQHDELPPEPVALPPTVQALAANLARLTVVDDDGDDQPS